MRKALLPIFLFLSLCLISCSGDSSSDENGSFVKFKIDGVQKTFTQVVVDKQDVSSGDVAYVVATNKNNPSEYVTFTLTDSQEYSINGFVFHVGDVTYENVGGGTTFTTTTTQYTSNRIKATFGGMMKEFFSNNNNVFKSFTEGSLDVKY